MGHAARTVGFGDAVSPSEDHVAGRRRGNRRGPTRTRRGGRGVGEGAREGGVVGGGVERRGSRGGPDADASAAEDDDATRREGVGPMPPDGVGRARRVDARAKSDAGAGEGEGAGAGSDVPGAPRRPSGPSKRPTHRRRRAFATERADVQRGVSTVRRRWRWMARGAQQSSRAFSDRTVAFIVNGGQDFPTFETEIVRSPFGSGFEWISSSAATSGGSLRDAAKAPSPASLAFALARTPPPHRHTHTSNNGQRNAEGYLRR